MNSQTTLFGNDVTICRKKLTKSCNFGETFEDNIKTNSYMA